MGIYCFVCTFSPHGALLSNLLYPRERHIGNSYKLLEPLHVLFESDGEVIIFYLLVFFHIFHYFVDKITRKKRFLPLEFWEIEKLLDWEPPTLRPYWACNTSLERGHHFLRNSGRGHHLLLCLHLVQDLGKAWPCLNLSFKDGWDLDHGIRLLLDVELHSL